MSAVKPVLWNYYISSASWRVRIAMNLKNIDYEYKSIDILGGGQYRDEFKRLNPKEEVPALQIDDHLLVQSIPIIEYIEETRKGVRLFPKDPILRAKARQIAEIINSGIQPYQNLNVIKRVNSYGGEEKRTEWAQFYLSKGAKVLEETLAETAGKYCVGDTVSIADICLVPQMSAFNRYNIDLSKCPRLIEVTDRLCELEAFRKADAYRQSDCPENLRIN